MTSLNRISFLNSTYQFGSDIVQDVIYTTHPLVHAIEQPIANVYTEAKTMMTGAWNASHAIIHLSAYGFLGWMAWEWVGDLFPNEKRAITNSVNRAMKRARLE
jgi:hypothetical protein